MTICKKTIEQDSSFVTGYPELVAEWNYAVLFTVDCEDSKNIFLYEEVW